MASIRAFRHIVVLIDHKSAEFRQIVVRPVILVKGNIHFIPSHRIKVPIGEFQSRVSYLEVLPFGTIPILSTEISNRISLSIR